MKIQKVDMLLHLEIPRLLLVREASDVSRPIPSRRRRRFRPEYCCSGTGGRGGGGIGFSERLMDVYWAIE